MNCRFITHEVKYFKPFCFNLGDYGLQLIKKIQCLNFSFKKILHKTNPK